MLSILKKPKQLWRNAQKKDRIQQIFNIQF